MTDADRLVAEAQRIAEKYSRLGSATYQHLKAEILSALQQAQARPEIETLREEIEQAAIRYRKGVEGEYGCNGLTCPGVKRLIRFAEEIASFAAPPRERGENLEAKWYPLALEIVGKYAPGEMGLANRLAREFAAIDRAPRDRGESARADQLRALERWLRELDGNQSGEIRDWADLIRDIAGPPRERGEWAEASVVASQEHEGDFIVRLYGVQHHHLSAHGRTVAEAVSRLSEMLSLDAAPPAPPAEGRTE